jgi:hypothetical protein
MHLRDQPVRLARIRGSTDASRDVFRQRGSSTTTGIFRSVLVW